MNKLVLPVLTLILAQNAYAACPAITGVYSCLDSNKQNHKVELQVEKGPEGESIIRQYRYGIRGESGDFATLDRLLFDGAENSSHPVQLRDLFGIGNYKGTALTHCDPLGRTVGTDLITPKSAAQHLIKQAEGGSDIEIGYYNYDYETKTKRASFITCSKARGFVVSPRSSLKDFSSLPNVIQAEIKTANYKEEFLNVKFKLASGYKSESPFYCMDSAFWGPVDNFDFTIDNVDIVSRDEQHIYSLCIDLKENKVFSGSKSGGAQPDSMIGSLLEVDGKYQIQFMVPTQLKDIGRMFVIYQDK